MPILENEQLNSSQPRRRALEGLLVGGLGLAGFAGAAPRCSQPRVVSDRQTIDTFINKMQKEGFYPSGADRSLLGTVEQIISQSKRFLNDPGAHYLHYPQLDSSRELQKVIAVSNQDLQFAAIISAFMHRKATNLDNYILYTWIHRSSRSVGGVRIYDQRANPLQVTSTYRMSNTDLANWDNGELDRFAFGQYSRLTPALRNPLEQVVLELEASGTVDPGHTQNTVNFFQTTRGAISI